MVEVMESLKYKILKWILLVSNITSLIVDILVIVGGKRLVELFTTVPKDAEDLPIRLFSAVEAIIVVIAIFGIIKRNFVVFAVHCGLLTLYFAVSLFFTKVLVIWFWVLAVLLLGLSFGFLYLLYKLKKKLENPYGV
jgi:hypothetical protein